MKIRMKETTPVSTTGLNKLIWEKGKVYDAPTDLAANLVKGELAELKPGTKLPEEPIVPLEGGAETPEGDTPPVDETPEDGAKKSVNKDK